MMHNECGRKKYTAKNKMTPRSASSPTAGLGGFTKYIWLAHQKQYKLAIAMISLVELTDCFLIDFSGFNLQPLNNKPPYTKLQTIER